jgi:DNA helicase-2/ATP-dependent DNA helicase PcrA
MIPTTEQEAILDAVTKTDSNLIINALAGTGKTSTLRLIDRALPASLPCLYLAFNKRIVQEALEPDDSGDSKFRTLTAIRTFNSLGHRIWADSIGPSLSLNTRKTSDLFKLAISEFSKEDQKIAWEDYSLIADGVNKAKALGYVPEGKYEKAKRLISRSDFIQRMDEEPSDYAVDLIDEILLLSIRSAYSGQIDFNDQIYMPALFGGTLPRYPLVLVDEAQDLNPVNHELLRKLGKGRVLAVGDPWQSVYGFRGAVQDGMAKIQAKFEMMPLDLSVSFRCPKVIVQNAQWRVPHLKWFKEGGHVERLQSIQIASIPDNSTIICRNNAPLFKLALQLLANKRGVSVAGSDLGPRIVGIMRKLGPDRMPRQELEDEIETWRLEKTEKQSKSADDIADCMRVFASFGTTLGQAIAYADYLFKQQGSIQLLTGHKAKGLEFETVYHLDPWLIKDCNGSQEKNLRYVIQTRSKNRYFEIDSKDIKHEAAL